MKAVAVPAAALATPVSGAIQAIAALLAKMAPMGTGVLVVFPAGLARWAFLVGLELLERMGNLG